MKKIIQIIMAVLLAMPVIGQKTVQVEDVINQSPGEVLIPVNMLGFISPDTIVGSLTLQIQFDDNLLQYIGTSNVNPSFAGLIIGNPLPNTVKITYSNLGGAAINGKLLDLKFKYFGGFTGDFTFNEFYSEVSSPDGIILIAKVFDNGSITPLASANSITIGSNSAIAGNPVSIPVLMAGTGFTAIKSLTLRIAYDQIKLSYLNFTLPAVSGISAGVANGIITLTWSSLTPVDLSSLQLLQLNFTYLGGGTASVACNPGSIVTGDAGVILNTKFISGAVQLTPPTAGTLTIGKVSSVGATFEIVPNQPPGTNDTVWHLAVVSVPITANGITELAGVVDLKIAFDNTKLTYTGPYVISGWVVSSNQSLGTLSFTKTSSTAFPIDGVVLTLNFGYLNGVADITFEPSTILQKIDGITPIPVGLVDGYVSQFIAVNAKVYLQGAWNVSNGNMNTALLTNGVIPLAQPYSGAPWNYAGTENVSSIPANVVDWVLVELRTGTAAATMVGQRAGFLLNDGTIVDLDGTTLLEFTNGLTAGNYYIVVSHRNHLAIMSATAQLLDANSVLYNFTTAKSQSFFDPLLGSFQVKDLTAGNWGMFGGNGNGDGIVFTPDYQLYLQQRTQYGYKSADYDMNATVFTPDYFRIWQFNRTIRTHVP